MAPNGPFQLGKARGCKLIQIRDGTSNTIMVGEKHVPQDRFAQGWWDNSLYNGDVGISCLRAGGPTYPMARSPQDPNWRFGSYHPGLCQFVFCDGSVHSLRSDLDPYTFGLLCDKCDGQVIQPFE